MIECCTYIHVQLTWLSEICRNSSLIFCLQAIQYALLLSYCKIVTDSCEWDPIAVKYAVILDIFPTTLASFYF